MTEVQRAIVLVGMMEILLQEDELPPATKNLKDACALFSNKQSGVEMVLSKRLLAPRITNTKRYTQFLETMKTSDKIWVATLSRYAKQAISIDVVTTVVAIYEFYPEVLHKHTRIKKELIDAYVAEGPTVDDENRIAGAVVGGYIVELLAAEMGIKINGRLHALKGKIERQLGWA